MPVPLKKYALAFLFCPTFNDMDPHLDFDRP